MLDNHAENDFRFNIRERVCILIENSIRKRFFLKAIAAATATTAEENYSNFSPLPLLMKKKQRRKILLAKTFPLWHQAKGSEKKLFSIHLSPRIFSLSTRNLSMYLRESSDIETKERVSHSSFPPKWENSLSYHKNPINQSDFVVYIITLFVAAYVALCRDLLRKI